MVAIWALTHVLHQQSSWNTQQLPLVKADALGGFNVHLVSFFHHEVGRAKNAVHGMHKLKIHPDTVHIRNQAKSNSQGMQQ